MEETFLAPGDFRVVNATMISVIKEVPSYDRRKVRYILRTYHNKKVLENPPHKGIPEEYNSHSDALISKDFYEGFIKEAKRKQREWDNIQKKVVATKRTCGVCFSSVPKGKPCPMCMMVKKGIDIHDKRLTKRIKELRNYS